MDSSPDRETAKFRSQIPQYVAGIMSPRETVEFEAWLVEHPEFASEIDVERQMRRGFLAAHRAGLLAAQPHSNPWRQWFLAVSAAAMVAVVAVAVVAQIREAGSGVDADSVIALADHSHSQHGTQIITLARTRSMSAAPDIRATLAQLPDHLVLQPNVVVYTCADGSFALECTGGAAPSLPQYAEYDLEIVERSNGRVAYRSRPVGSAPDTPLVFVLHPRALPVGDYDLLVRGRSVTHEEIVGRFWLQINANP